jgi:hypothetical protein
MTANQRLFLMIVIVNVGLKLLEIFHDDVRIAINLDKPIMLI